MKDSPGVDKSQPSPKVDKRIRKVIVSTSPGSKGSQQPVVVRRSNSSASSIKVNRSIHKPLPVSKAIKSNSVNKSRPQLGKPDFASTIITGNASFVANEQKVSSPQQRLFFDAAIAVVSISFMVLTFLHL